jgi:hypothetical protein
MVSLYSPVQVNMALSPSKYIIVNGSETEKTKKTNINLSERLLFSAQLGILQLYYGENKLHSMRL